MTHTRKKPYRWQLLRWQQDQCIPHVGPSLGISEGLSFDPGLCSVVVTALSFPPLFLSLPYLTPCCPEQNWACHVSFLQLEHLSDERGSVADGFAGVWGTQDSLKNNSTFTLKA